MTERGARHCAREADCFTIGPSQLQWDGQQLTIHIDEVGVPLPRRIRGTVRVVPEQLFQFSTALDRHGRHHWGPIAPNARVEVDLAHPSLRWRGHAYLDSNEGSEPVDRAFTEWDWSRCQLADGSTAVLYDIEPGQPGGRVLALRFHGDGSVTAFDPPPMRSLPRTAWRLPRRMRSDSPVSVLQQLEDTPFYQRAVLRSQLLGEAVTGFHETLNVPRLVSLAVACARAAWPARRATRGAARSRFRGSP